MVLVHQAFSPTNMPRTKLPSPLLITPAHPPSHVWASAEEAAPSSVDEALVVQPPVVVVGPAVAVEVSSDLRLAEAATTTALTLVAAVVVAVGVVSDGRIGISRSATVMLPS
jgi:hypothetical protein